MEKESLTKDSRARAVSSTKGKEAKRKYRITMNRKTERIARPSMWKRKAQYRIAVFTEKCDKKGRRYVKTPGGLKKTDFLKNRWGKVVSVKKNMLGKKLYKHIQPSVDARKVEIIKLGLKGFVRARPPGKGTCDENRVYLAMKSPKLSEEAKAAIQKIIEEEEKKQKKLTQYFPQGSGGAASSSGQGARGSDKAERSNAKAKAAPAPVEMTSDQTNKDDDEATFAPGDMVIIEGLNTSQGKTFNGRKAVVVQWGAVEGRYAVRFPHAPQGSTEDYILVKPENIRGAA